MPNFRALQTTPTEATAGVSLTSESDYNPVATEFNVDVRGSGDDWKSIAPGSPIFALYNDRATRTTPWRIFSVASANAALQAYFSGKSDTAKSNSALPLLEKYFSSRMDGDYSDFFEQVFVPAGILTRGTFRGRNELEPMMGNQMSAGIVAGPAHGVGNYWGAWKNGDLIGFRLGVVTPWEGNYRHEGGVEPRKCLAIVPTLGEVSPMPGPDMGERRIGAKRPRKETETESDFFSGSVNFYMPAETLGLDNGKLPSREIRLDLPFSQSFGVLRLFCGAFWNLGKVRNSNAAQPPNVVSARASTFSNQMYLNLQKKWRLTIHVIPHSLLRFPADRMLVDPRILYSEYKTDEPAPVEQASDSNTGEQKREMARKLLSIPGVFL